MSYEFARHIKAVVANTRGEIFELDDFHAVGMAGETYKILRVSDIVTMPHGSELMFLPDRKPVVYNPRKKRIETIDSDPYDPAEPIFPVAVFNSPGYMLCYTCAHEQNSNVATLPLFSYGAVGWHHDRFVSAAVCVDREKRQDLRLMKHEKILAGIQKMRKLMPRNRLREHLENCALVYGCPAGKNFFLGRFEAPLPTSKNCNARCIGCLSLQPENRIPVSQNRISFTPTPEEIAEVALAHIKRVKNSVVSFGQGCEGDPLMAAKVIGPAVKIIRQSSGRGTININTNAGRPDLLEPLFLAGIDSIRVSINSIREKCYNAYFRPVGYDFSRVMESIRLAGQHKKFVSINYLNCPGVTDSYEETQALMDFLGRYPIDMIQWRNLNYDPVEYYRTMKDADIISHPIGMKTLLKRIRKKFPKLRFGYFNPSVNRLKSR